MSLVDQIKELKELHDDGALTDDEFETAKAKLLEASGDLSTKVASDDGAPNPGDDDEVHDPEAIAERMYNLFNNSSAETLLVAQDGQGNFNDLKTAIDAAPSGATIRVKAGTYVGPIHIDKDLTILGEKGVRVRLELPEEIAVRLFDQMCAADDALDYYQIWSMPEIILKQLDENVTYNPIKQLKIRHLKKELESPQRLGRWEAQAKALQRLDSLLWDRFISIEDARVTIKDVVFGFSDDEADAFMGEGGLQLVPANMRRDTTKVLTYDGEKGARTPWVSASMARHWADDSGFDDDDLYATQAQHRRLERAANMSQGTSDPKDPASQWRWWNEQGGQLRDVTTRLSSRGMERLAALRDGKGPQWTVPMLSFTASDADHGLILDDCMFLGHNMFTEGICAQSTHNRAELFIRGCGIMGVKSAHKFDAKESLWKYNNAVVSITWPQKTSRGRLQIEGSAIEGGYVGIDAKSGHIDIDNCMVANNTAIGIRVYGKDEKPMQASATITGCTVRHQELAAILGFRYDSETSNYTARFLTTENCGKWDTAIVKSAKYRKEEQEKAKE